VRPEHTDLVQDGVPARVDVSEMMGSSVHLHLTAEGRDVIVIVPTVGLKESFRMGDTVHFGFNGNVAHVFSKETDKNLEF
jgi:multiple sugar transport system ATP-binding protein